MSVQVSLFDEGELKHSKVAARVDEIVGGRFDVRKFVEHFPTLAGADGGTGRLREMVLGLAVRGLLVPQIADEESVDAVLAKLGRASEKCEDDPKHEKELRAGLGTPPEPPWSVPSAWRFVRLEETSAGGGLFCDGDWVESKDQDPTGAIHLTQLADVGDGVWRDRSNRYMNRHTADRLRCTYLEVGDILIARMPDPIGRACIFPGDKKSCATVVDVAVLRIRQEFFDRRYVMMAVNSKPVRDHINTLIAGTTRQRVSRSNLASVVIPLPALAEQKRIVAKVDQLMALCDDLEARQAKKRETAVRLNRAALDALTTAERPEEFDAAWKRVAENFGVLFDGPGVVLGLRQVIRRLAVRGHLVGYPSVWHEAEAAHRPWRTPAHWRWERADGLCQFITKGTTPSRPEMSEGQGEIPFLKVYNLTFGNSVDFTVKPTFVTERVHERVLARSHVMPGDVLMNIVGPPLGKVSLVPNSYPKWNINQAIARFRPKTEVVGSFLALCLLDVAVLMSFGNAEVKGSAGQDNISLAQCRALLIPVPPLEEQKRIVAKVDQLMALCDTLEAALRRAESTAQKLAEAVVAEIVA